MLPLPLKSSYSKSIPTITSFRSWFIAADDPSRATPVGRAGSGFGIRMGTGSEGSFWWLSTNDTICSGRKGSGSSLSEN